MPSASKENTATYLPLKYLASCHGSGSSGYPRQDWNDEHNNLQDCLSLPQIQCRLVHPRYVDTHTVPSISGDGKKVKKYAYLVGTAN
jgi:hypothetical protein